MTPAARVWLASAAYAAVYYALGSVRYAAYRSGSDLGLFTQSIATAFAGFTNTTEGGSHFTYHFSPILFLCAPLLLWAHSPLALIAVQAVAGALVAPPLFFIARKRVPDGLASAIAGVALLYPPLAGVTFADFHENGFAPAATMWLLWAVDARRLRLAAVFLALALGIKEDQAAIVGFTAGLALVHFVRTGDRSRAAFAGAATLVCAVVFVAFFAFVRPAAGAHDAWAPTHFYAWSGGDARGRAPWYSIGRPAYVFEAFLPLAFAALASPAIAFAIPGFVEVLGSHESITYTMGQHYAAVWIAYVLFAFALAIGATYARAPRRATAVVRAALALCALVLVFASPTHWGHYVRARTAHDAARDRALARLPRDAEVGVADDFYAHLGFDPHALLGFERRPRYALLDAKDDGAALNVTWRPIIVAAARSGAYRLVWSDDGVELYERPAAR
ncbi:MAG: hypothetical protein NVSMB19_25680 [Vulcanimicrobiaceae bacterium]